MSPMYANLDGFPVRVNGVDFAVNTPRELSADELEACQDAIAHGVVVEWDEPEDEPVEDPTDDDATTDDAKTERAKPARAKRQPGRKPGVTTTAVDPAAETR